MKRLYIDLETDGLNPFKNKPVLAQYMWEGDSKVTLIPNPTAQDLADLFDQADQIVMHNSPFDFGMAHYVPDPSKIVDTAYLSRIQDYLQEEHSLDVVAKRTLGYDPYRGYDKKAMQRSDWSGELSTQQKRYAEIDVEILPTIAARFKRTLSHPVYQFDAKSISAGLAIQRHGLPVDHDAVKLDITKSQCELANLLAKLPCNPNSPKQVCETLGLDTSNDKALAGLEASGDVLAKDIRRARQLGKYLNFLQKLIAGDRYYGTLFPGAQSGRFRSSKENLQQIPRSQKKFIGVRSDRVVISADYAQLELRCIATLAKDRTMVHLFRDDADLHGYTAEQLFGPDYTKDQRYIAKTFNFSLLYGAGAKTVQQMLLAQTGILMPEHEVAKLKRKWVEAYKGIAQWQKEGSKRFEMGFEHFTPMGRPYMAKSYTQMLSLENQGYGAEVARWALHYILDHLPEGVDLINFVHDSFLIECPNDPELYKPAAKVVHDAMRLSWENAPIHTYGVPMPIDVGVAFNWKDADALENCVYVYEGE